MARIGRRHRSVAMAAAPAIALVWAAGSLFPAAAQSPSAPVYTGNKVIGLANADLQFPFFEAVRQGVVAEAERQGWQVLVQSAADGAEQTTQVKQLLAQDIEALVYLPSGADAATVPVTDANAAGVPVVTVDRNPPGDGQIVSFIAADSVPGAQGVCDYMAQGIGGTGEVIWIEGQIGTTPWEARTEGCNAALAAYPEISIVGKAPADWGREKGYNVARDLLQAHPNTVGIFGMSDDMAIGAAQAAAAAGKDPFVVGFDGLPAALQAIKDGKVDATMIQPAFHLGELAAQAAIKAAMGDIADIPAEQLIPTILVTQENVDEYLNKGYYGTLG